MGKDDSLKGLFNLGKGEKLEREEDVSGVGGFGAVTKRLEERKKNPQPYETEIKKEEVEEQSLEEEVVEGFLGMKVVNIKEVLTGNHFLQTKENTIATAIAESNGEEFFVGIYPGIDHEKIMPGDKALYDDEKKYVCRIIETFKPSKIPQITFDDIGGLEEQKEALKSLLEYFDPKARERFAKLKRKFRNGGLLFGPPGTGKTMLAEAAANYARVPFFFVNTPEVFKEYLGSTVNTLKSLHSAAKKEAKKSGGAILYFDEVTRLASERDYSGGGGAEKEVAGATEEFQALMNGTDEVKPEDGLVLTLASTNLAHIFDPAMLRRFSKHIKVPTPDLSTKRKIFQVKLAKVPNRDISIEELVNSLEDINTSATGADIELVTEEAKVKADKMGRSYLTMQDYAAALTDYSTRVDVVLKRGR
ncbi:AAA family ATPase [Candidatus Woesearchaeota archaeon]|nr:AAA family ATPase [Candidatus Woesearchaeota archaeon]